MKYYPGVSKIINRAAHAKIIYGEAACRINKSEITLNNQVCRKCKHQWLIENNNINALSIYKSKEKPISK
jgi:hypothetical protein